MADHIEVLDKSWLFESSTSIKFQGGLNSFLDFAEIYSNHKMEPGLKLPCPCSKCHNDKYYDRKTISEHVICFSFDNAYRYKTWYMHGELILGSRAYKKALKRKRREKVCATSTAPPVIVENEMTLLVNEAMVDPTIYRVANQIDEAMTNVPIDDLFISPINHPDNLNNDPINTPIDDRKFNRRLRDANEQLYPGCTKYTKLSAILHLYHIKCLNGVSNKFFEMLLEFLRDVIPSGDTSIPKTMHEAKSYLRDLGLNYVKIDACPNNCILYRKEFENSESCIRCNEPRWKVERKANGKHIPIKVLRHFPLVPRLKRLYMCSKVCISC